MVPMWVEFEDGLKLWTSLSCLGAGCTEIVKHVIAIVIAKVVLKSDIVIDLWETRTGWGNQRILCILNDEVFVKMPGLNISYEFTYQEPE